MPADKVDTRFPRLKEGTYRLVIRSPETRTSDKGTRMVSFKVETTKDVVDTDDRPLYSGFRFTHRLIGVSGERDANAVAKEGAILLKAVGLGSMTVGQLFDNPGVLDGKLVDAKVSIEKERDGFPETNRVKAFIIPAA